MKEKMSTEEKKRRRALYDKKRMENNPEKYRERKRLLYRERSPERIKKDSERSKKYSKDNKEKKAEYKRKRYPKIKEKIKILRENGNYAISHRKAVKKWSKKGDNYLIRRSQARARHYKKKTTKEELTAIVKWESEWKSKSLCLCTFCLKEIPVKQADVEHFYCLSGGGEHRLNNLTIACKECNGRKYVKDPFEFIREVVYEGFEPRQA